MNDATKKATKGSKSAVEQFVMWVFSPAQYWQFWKPQSGFIGGIIFGTMFICLIPLVVWLAT